MKKKILVLLSFFLLSLSPETGNISLHMESKKLHNGKVFIIKADVFYNVDGNMTLHYTYPQEYVFITNPKGEIKVYYPSTNKVLIQQNEIFSSENDVLYSFFSQKTTDMGLKESGFVIQNSRYQQDMMITTWLPPISEMDKISKIEMAHENYLPIYTAIYNTKSKFSRKIYYSDYMNISQYSFPLKITEIEYLANGDSIISRKQYSDFKTGIQAKSAYFNYTIPSNATLIKLPDNNKNL